MMRANKIGSVLVVGGGIGGIQAALDLADSGYYVYMLEKAPSICGERLERQYNSAGMGPRFARTCTEFTDCIRRLMHPVSEPGP